MKIYQASLYATFVATKADWLALAARLQVEGEKRLGDAIESGVKAQSGRHDYFNYDDWPIALRFRGGSIAKLQAIEREQES